MTITHEARTVPFRQVTFLGVPATVATVALSRANRIHVTRWLADAVGQPTEWPAGTVRLVRSTGDARKGTLVVHDEVTLTDPTDDDVTAAIANLRQGF